MKIDYSSRILHIEDLQRRFTYLEGRHKYGQPEEDADQAVWDEWHELEELRDVQHQLDYCWGEASTMLVRVTHWTAWCEETSYDLGEIQQDSLVARHVNWEGVADAMRQDYRSVKLPDDYYFYVRA